MRRGRRRQRQQVLRREHGQGALRRALDQQPAGPGRGRDDQRLEKHLAHPAGPRRAERGADGELVLAPDRGGEEQVADVGAGDQQHQRDRCLQEQQHRSLRRRRARCATRRSRCRACVALVVGYSIRRRAMIASRSSRAWSRVTPGRSRPVTLRNPASREARRGSVSIGNGATSSASRTGVMKAAGSTPTIGVGVAVEHERRAEDRRAAAEAPHPEPVGQHDHPRAAPGLVLGQQRPPERGACAQDGEERRRGLHALHALGLAAGEVGAPLERRGERLERAVAVAQVAVVGDRQRLVERVERGSDRR